MSHKRSISNTQARAHAIAAAQLGTPRPPKARSRAQAHRRAVDMVHALGYLQIDSVNVLARAHDLVLFSRIGAVPKDVLTTTNPQLPPAGTPLPPVIEQWSHEASLMPPAIAHTLSAFPTRHRSAPETDDPSRAEWEQLHQASLAHLASSPATALSLATRLSGDDPRRRTMAQWAIDRHFAHRRVVGIGRTPPFERILSPSHFASPPPRAQAAIELTRIAIRGLGVATASTVADWFRLPIADTLGTLKALEVSGEVSRVHIVGMSSSTASPMRSSGAGRDFFIDEGGTPELSRRGGPVSHRYLHPGAQEGVRVLRLIDPVWHRHYRTH